jgi:4-carboxymuconolactone decarboxylase
MARVPPVEFDTLNAEQQAVYKQIAGPREGNVGGPYTVWIKTPAIADAMNRVGDVLRVNGKLDKRLMELMVLLVSRHWRCDYQWAVHADAAVKAGLGREVMEAIRLGRKPEFAREDERAVYDAITELLESKALSQATYDRVLGALGMELLIELVTNTGRYCQAAIVSNCFEIEIPGGKRFF